MISRFLIIVLLSILFSSCLDSIIGGRYVKSIKIAQRGIEECYQIDGLFNQFPKSISYKSFIRIKSCIPAKTFDPESVYSAYLLLFLEMEEDYEEFYPDTFLYKTKYDRLNFILDDSFSYYQYTDTLKTRNVVQPDAYPIPYFERHDFGLGFERIDLRGSGVTLVRDRHNVPEDLEVFVFKAGYGNFWEIEFEQDRPDTLGNWKNGYSSGIAISKELNMAIYWMMAW